MTGTRTRAPAGQKPRHTVSTAHDPAERQADQVADVVTRGGSVSGWSLGSVPLRAGVHREEAGTKKASNEEKLKDAAAKAGEAALETKAGKQLQQAVKDLPEVRAATKFLDTTAGKVVAGGVIAAGVGGLAAAKQPLPVQAPAIPLDRLTPGLSAKVTVEGPVNAPTFVGLSLTYREQGPKRKGPSDKESITADTARLRADQERFRPQAEKDQQRADEQAAVARFLAAQSARFGQSTLIPLGGATQPKTVAVPKETGEEQKEQPDESPVQREPATTSPETALDTSGVPGAVRGGGRPLEPAMRRSMEARFGVDFGGVRLHDDASAAAAAAGVRARAFTVGEDIVVAPGVADGRTAAGRHLLAHELAHVVQQRGANGTHIHRRGALETIGIWLGLTEGSWSDKELRAYLDQITTKNKIDGSYDADNRARAVVRKWKAAAPGWELSGQQKSLLIDEMLDGPTLGDDEECIMDLLERSDAGDLRTIFTDAPKRMRRLDRDIDWGNHDRLDRWVAGRIKGGRPALLAGRVEVLGDSVPAAAPTFAFDAGTVESWLDSDRSWEEVLALIDRYPPADRSKALDHLLRTVWPASKATLGRARAQMSADGVTEDQKTTIFDATATVRARVRKIERLLMRAYATSVPTDEAALRAGTKPADPAQAGALRDVLLPHQYAAEAAAEDAKIELEEGGADATAKEPAGKAPAGKEPAKGTGTAGKEPAKTTGKADPDAPAPRVGFHDPEKYRAEVEKELPGIINEKYKSHVTEAGPRAGMPEIEAMAVPAKKATDVVFGQFYDAGKHPELKGDRPGKRGNLHFWYDTASKELRVMGPDDRRELAISWLLYYFQSDSTIRGLNDKYNASPSFRGDNSPKNAEARILVGIAKRITRAPAPAKGAKAKGAKAEPSVVEKLVETWRNWGGMARGREVFVDLYHSPDADADRDARWDMFQTLIHEYLHTLVHPDYEKFAMGFGESSPQWNTLIEGVDSVLDEIVWAHVLPRTAEPGLRKIVEGDALAAKPHKEPPYPGRYPSHDEAMRLVRLVGIENVYAAYFLGLVDRIRATAPVKRVPRRRGARHEPARRGDGLRAR